MIRRSSWQIQKSVIFALFLRELNMRFSSGRMGLFWTFFEPFFQILVFVLIKLLLFGGEESGFDFAVFLALNFTAFNMFKNIVTKSIASFSANKSLFMYKQVKPIDTIIARVIIEVFITAIIIVIFLIIGTYFNFDIDIKNLVMVFIGFCWLVVFSVSLGLLLAILNIFISSISKLIGFLMTALMFASAVFYTMEMLPLEFQFFLLFNPLVHFMELIHGFYFYALDDKFVSYSYILMWTIIPLYLALWLYIKLEKRIVSL